MAKTPKFQCFKINRRQERKYGEYEAFEVTVSIGSDFSQGYDFRDGTSLRFTWQANLRDDGRWYAGRVVVESTDAELFSYTGKMLKAMSFTSSTQPVEVVEYLIAKGFVYVAWHSMEMDYQAVGSWPTGCVWRIINDKNQALKYIMAMSEYHAQQIAKAWMLKQSEHSSYWEKELVGWLTEGKPVVRVTDEIPLPELPDMLRQQTAPHTDIDEQIA